MHRIHKILSQPKIYNKREIIHDISCGGLPYGQASMILSFSRGQSQPYLVVNPSRFILEPNFLLFDREVIFMAKNACICIRIYNPIYYIVLY